MKFELLNTNGKARLGRLDLIEELSIRQPLCRWGPMALLKQ